MSKVHVKKGDKVVVLSGVNKGVQGKVIAVNVNANRVLVEGVNMRTKHVKPRNQMQPGGITKQEAPIHASNVMLICPKCGEPTKVAKEILDSGSKVRTCKKCKEHIDVVIEAK